MPLTRDVLCAAFAELPAVEGDDILARGKPVAARLYAVLDAVRAESEIAELDFWGFSVELVLKSGDQWSIECLSPDAFRMYPGSANIWVRATDMDVDELVRQLNDVAFPVSRDV